MVGGGLLTLPVSEPVSLCAAGGDSLPGEVVLTAL